MVLFTSGDSDPDASECDMDSDGNRPPDKEIYSHCQSCSQCTCAICGKPGQLRINTSPDRSGGCAACWFTVDDYRKPVHALNPEQQQNQRPVAEHVKVDLFDYKAFGNTRPCYSTKWTVPTDLVFTDQTKTYVATTPYALIDRLVTRWAVVGTLKEIRRRWLCAARRMKG